MVAKKKTRIKQAALTAAVQSRVEASAQIRRIGDLAREVKRLEAEMGDKQAAIEQEYNELADPLRAELAELTGGVQAYCEANREELTEGYKTKTVDFVTGIVKWRADPPSVRVTGVAAVLAYLKEKTALARFVRLKEEINKEAILNGRAVCRRAGAGYQDYERGGENRDRTQRPGISGGVRWL